MTCPAGQLLGCLGAVVVVGGLVVVVVVMSRVRPAQPVGMDRLEEGHGAQPPRLPKLQRYCPDGQEVLRGAAVVVVGALVVVVVVAAQYKR